MRGRFCFCSQFSGFFLWGGGWIKLSPFCFLIYANAVLRQAQRVILSHLKRWRRWENRWKLYFRFLSWNWRNCFIHFHISLNWKALSFALSYGFSLSHKYCITLMITPTHTHTKRDRYTRPFPARPCRCSRNSRVGLNGKQTVRGCWESSAGLQITVGLTKVSEPAPLLPHTYMHCTTHPHEHRALRTLKAL